MICQLKQPRRHHSAVQLNNTHLYLIGGQFHVSVQSDCLCKDLSEKVFNVARNIHLLFIFYLIFPDNLLAKNLFKGFDKVRKILSSMEKIDLATGEIKSCAKLPTSWVKIAATAYKVNKLNRLLSFIEARENFVSSCMFCKTLLLLQYFPQKLDDHKYVKTMRLVS